MLPAHGICAARPTPTTSVLRETHRRLSTTATGCHCTAATHHLATLQLVSIVAKISQLTFSDETAVTLPESGVTVIVGPNNSGKSRSLREIAGSLQSPANPSEPHRVVLNVTVEKIGEDEEVRGWLEDRGTRVERAEGTHWMLPRMGGPLTEEHIQNLWRGGPPFGQLAGPLVFVAGAQERLGLVSSVNQIDYRSQEHTHPLHWLYRDKGLEEELSDISASAFGTPALLDRYAGLRVHLLFGERPEWRGDEGVPTEEYLGELRRLPVVHDQGDGVRSFLGLMLELVVGDFHWLLVDEPEAFLHPPQAHLLGAKMAEHASRGRQVILATHSSHVLRGVLSANEPNTQVIRITRSGDVNPVSVLDPEDVRKLWDDPLLRYSEVLDGLFQDAVVLCEGNADCRYYSSVMSVVCSDDGLSEPDLHWTHSGGTARMPTVLRALRSVEVPVHVVADFDVLRDRQPLKNIVEELGGNWSMIEPTWQIVTAAIDSTAQPLDTEYLRQEFPARLADVTNPRPTSQELDELRSLLKERRGWADAKKAGIGAVPQGDASQACHELVDLLGSVGLHVVPVGELERFVPTVSGHGPAWVSEVHASGAHEDRNNETAMSFVRSLRDSLGLSENQV